MSKNRVIFEHMQEDICDILTFINEMPYSQFVNNVLVIKAVCMSLINIGELTKSLPWEFKQKHNEIPWKNISGLRDIAAHKYHTINVDIIWQVVSHEILPLKTFIENFLEKK